MPGGIVFYVLFIWPVNVIKFCVFAHTSFWILPTAFKVSWSNHPFFLLISVKTILNLLVPVLSFLTQQTTRIRTFQNYR